MAIVYMNENLILKVIISSIYPPYERVSHSSLVLRNSSPDDIN